MAVLTLKSPGYIVLIVEDLERALHFYMELLGLPLRHRSGPFAQLDTGSTRLALFTREAMGTTIGQSLHPPAPDAAAFELGFVVDDIDAAFAALVAAGAQVQTEPADRSWGQRTGYLRDPDGHLIELVQLRAEAHSGPA